MTTRGATLAETARSRADWQPWLAVLERVAEAAGDRAWRIAVPEAPAPDAPGAPLVAGARFVLDARLVRRWGRRLLETAAGAGGTAASLGRLVHAEADALSALLQAALVQDTGRVQAVAEDTGVEPEALAAAAAMLPVPLLRACTERWRDRIPAAWSAGHCPVCGAWPTLAEARGLERSRRLRCGRCACDWPGAWLRCPYCGTDDHTRLGALVVDPAGPAAAGERVEAPAPGAVPPARAVRARDPIRTTSVETCATCRGYLKTVTTLGPTAADELGLLDLTTIELDVAAIEHGYARPAGSAVPLDVRVETRGGGLFGGWRG